MKPAPEDLLRALGLAQHGVTDPRLALLQATGGATHRTNDRRVAPPPSNPPQPTGAVGETGGLLAPNLDEHLARVPGTFIQKHGPRAGQRYRVKQGESGKSERVYASGDTADVSHPYFQDQPRAAPPALGQLGGGQTQPLRQPDPSLGGSAEVTELLRRLLAGRP